MAGPTVAWIAGTRALDEPVERRLVVGDGHDRDDRVAVGQLEGDRPGPRAGARSRRRWPRRRESSSTSRVGSKRPGGKELSSGTTEPRDLLAQALAGGA